MLILPPALLYRVEKMEATLQRGLYLETFCYAKVRESILFDQWSGVGREDDLAMSRSYRAPDPGGESTIFRRVSDNDIHTFRNACLHHSWWSARAESTPIEYPLPFIRNCFAARLNTTLPSD